MIQDVFIVNVNRYGQSYSTTSNINVCFTKQLAFLHLLKHAFQHIDYEAYLPEHRFYKRRYIGFSLVRCKDIEVIDHWKEHIGINDHFIEVWSRNNDDAQRTETIWFDFDSAFKQKIINDSLSSAEVSTILIDFKHQINNGVIPDFLFGCFVNKKQSLQHVMTIFKVSDANQWIQRYGSIPPYPWTPDKDGICF